MGVHRMPADAVLRHLGRLDGDQVDYRVGGGWGVDALLQEQTREHSDLYLWLPAAHLERLLPALAADGLDRVFPWPGDRPWNSVLHDGQSRRVDLHLHETLPDGSIHYGSVIDGSTLPCRGVDRLGRHQRRRGTVRTSAVGPPLAHRLPSPGRRPARRPPSGITLRSGVARRLPLSAGSPSLHRPTTCSAGAARAGAAASVASGRGVLPAARSRVPSTVTPNGV